MQDEAQDLIILHSDGSAIQKIELGAGQYLSYDFKIWHSYIIHYARSVGLEHRLAEAKSIAMAMIYSDYLPSVHMEKQMSMCELYYGAMSNKMYSESVPVEDVNTAQIMGSLTTNCFALLKYKDIRSNEIVKEHEEGVKRKFDNRILGNVPNRERFYTMIQDDGLIGGAQVMRKIDCMNVTSIDAPREDRLLEIRAFNLWVVMPKSMTDNLRVIKNGLSAAIWKNRWSTGGRGAARNTYESEKRIALLTQLGVVANGDKKRGIIKVKDPSRVVYDVDELSELSEKLMEGAIGCVRMCRRGIYTDREMQLIWDGLRGSFCTELEDGRVVESVREIFDRADDDIHDAYDGNDGVEQGGFDDYNVEVPLQRDMYKEIFQGARRRNDRLRGDPG
jgi:hypothetical protein